MEFYDRLKEKQVKKCKNGEEVEYYLSTQTILHYQKVIGVVLSYAKYLLYVKENVLERVKNIKVKKKETPVLDIEKLKRMIELLKDENIVYRTIITLIVLSGLRRSEVLALHWSGIYFENKKLTVKRSIIYVKNLGVVEKEIKTSTCIRTRTLPDSAVKMLRQYKKWQDMNRFRCGYINAGKLFTNWTGEEKNMLMPDTISAWFSDFLYKIGVDSKTASVRPGYSSIGITMEIYARMQKNRDIVAAEKN